MFTPDAIHQAATPNPNEVLVSGFDADGIPQNVLLRNVRQLRAALEGTPATFPNPEHAAKAADHASAAAAAALTRAEWEAIPPMIGDPPESNPASAEKWLQMSAAESALSAAQAALDATDPHLVNPARAPIEKQAYDAAIAQLTPLTPKP